MEQVKLLIDATGSLVWITKGHANGEFCFHLCPLRLHRSVALAVPKWLLQLIIIAATVIGGGSHGCLLARISSDFSPFQLSTQWRLEITGLRTKVIGRQHKSMVIRYELTLVIPV
jgi:hypothetical protein